MTYPESPTSPPPDVGWYYLRDGVQVGPLTEQRLLQAARQGEIAPETLVWQRGFHQHWKEAATVPMIAVHLGCFGQPRGKRSEALLRRADQDLQQSHAPLELERLTPEDLDDAVNAEEGLESLPDARQVHEILERASRHPPERSIPPASVGASILPNTLPQRKQFARAHKLVIAGVSLCVGVFGVLLLTRSQTPASASLADSASTAVIPALHRDTPTAVEARPASAAPLALHRDTPTAVEARPASAAPLASVAVDVRQSGAGEPASAAPSGAKAESAEGSAARVSVISGPLDAKAFETRLRRARPMFDRQCWDRLRLPLDGVTSHPEIRVEIAVDRTGHVYDVSSSKAPRGYHGAGLCIIGRIRGWQFAHAEHGSRAVMTVTRGRD